VFDHLFDQGQAPNSIPKKNQPDQGDFDLKLISKQGSFKSVLKALKKKEQIFAVILTSCSTWWLIQPSQHS